MKPTRPFVLHALVAACLAASALDAGAAAPAAATRAACALKPAGGDVPSQSADALSVTLDAAHPAGLANWDVRWWNKHRVWITLSAENRADAPAHLLPQMLLDARADGSAATVLVGPPLTLEPHARVTDRLSIYVSDDAKTLGVRLLGATLAGSVAGSFAFDCSDQRYDVGERALAVAPLMDEAFRVYFNGFVDPLPDPHAAYDQARLLGSGAQDGADIVWTLRALMQSVHDTHGWAVGPGEAPPARRVVATRAPESELRPDGTAVVRVHGVDTDSEVATGVWSTTLHEVVAALAARHPRGWVLDLRDLDADSPWPAFAALSTLLDGPAIGGFVNRTETQHWIADRGVARLAGGPALADVQPDAPRTAAARPARRAHRPRHAQRRRGSRGRVPRPRAHPLLRQPDRGLPDGRRHRAPAVRRQPAGRAGVARGRSHRRRPPPADRARRPAARGRARRAAAAARAGLARRGTQPPMRRVEPPPSR